MQGQDVDRLGLAEEPGQVDAQPGGGAQGLDQRLVSGPGGVLVERREAQRVGAQRAADAVVQDRRADVVASGLRLERRVPTGHEEAQRGGVVQPSGEADRADGEAHGGQGLEERRQGRTRGAEAKAVPVGAREVEHAVAARADAGEAGGPGGEGGGGDRRAQVGEEAAAGERFEGGESSGVEQPADEARVGAVESEEEQP
jgi:hypothetical protein